jgi:glucose/arabinose dehydrogenase
VKHLALGGLVAGCLLTVAAFAADSNSTEPTVPAGFAIEAIAHVPHARELALTPNGDLLVGTNGPEVDIVPDAEGDAGEPSIFARVPDDEASGLALASDALYVGATLGVWRVPYVRGERRAAGRAERVFAVRTGGAGGHSTTSVALSDRRLYASIGSSCNACEERDPTRATIQTMTPTGADATARAVHIRNAIALAVDPTTGDLWAGAAGQDELPHGHPYELFDDVSARAETPDYGWPTCVENRLPVRPGNDCSHVAVPLVAFPAYETPIGATFYPNAVNGRYAFPAAWRGGAFVALHGSWHRPLVSPLVAFVPIEGRAPHTAVDWKDPTKQWRPFVTDWQAADGRRIGRPTGIAVGADGSLFVADDDAGTVYRIRPTERR